jgi:hypothetical protein
MRIRLPAVLFSCFGCSLLTLWGCGRPTAVAPPAGEDPARPAVVRGQADREKSAEDGEGFRFPDDPGGELLAKVLPPTGTADPRADHARGPRRAPAPRGLEAPSMPLPPSRVDVLRLPPPRKGPALAPRLVLDEALDDAPHDPVPPQAQVLPAGGRIRVSAPDPNQPIPLPILAQPVPDRASLEDATAEVSTAAALAAPLPRRTAPAPFQRLKLPEPYENRRPLSLPVPEEKATPTAAAPRTPKP